MMTRKDFQLIADVVNDSVNRVHGLTPVMREQLAEEFANALQYTNDRFDYQRFVSACTE